MCPPKPKSWISKWYLGPWNVEREGLILSSNLLSKFVWYHGDEWDREEASLSGMGQEVPLHPILVFRFLVDNDDDVILFESQLVLVVSRAVVQGSTPTPTRGMLLKKTKEYRLRQE